MRFTRNIGGTEAQVQGTWADQWSFLPWQFGVPGFPPAQHLAASGVHR